MGLLFLLKTILIMAAFEAVYQIKIRYVIKKDRE